MKDKKQTGPSDSIRFEAVPANDDAKVPKIKEPSVIDHELHEAAKCACHSGGMADVIVKDSKDISAVQKAVTEMSRHHTVGIRVNPKQKVRVLWRKL